MQKHFLVILGLCAAFLALPGAAVSQKKPATRPSSPTSKPAAPKTSPSKKPSPKVSASKTSKKPPTAAVRKKPSRTASVPRGQLRPTRDRYAEIQTALAQAGFFEGPANGQWGSSSVKALTAFQKDQGLEPTGKIDALSLIQLGLGPEYNAENQPLSSTAASSP